MQRLFFCQENKVLETVNNESEDKLNQFIWDNRKTLFPKYIFISPQFCLKEDGKKKFIDIFAYNPKTEKFIIIELKIGYDEHVIHQATNYRDILLETFGNVFVKAKDVCRELPDHKQIDSKAADIIIIAKNFRKAQIEKAKDEKKGCITLIEYEWFENDILLFDYVREGTLTTKPKLPKTTNENGDNKKPNEKFIESFVEKGWEANINSMLPANIKKQLKAIPFETENIDRLKELAKKASSPVKQAVLKKLLEKLETGGTGNDR